MRNREVFKQMSVLLLMFVMIGCAVAVKKNQVVEGPRVHNLAPEFIEFWKSVESELPEIQLKKLKSEFFPKFSVFYEYKIEKWKKAGKNADEEMLKHLKEFPEMKAEFIRKTEELSKNLNDTLEIFVKSFPDLNKDFDVYVTHSFGDMDGGTRKIGDEIYFILGIDGMVKYHKGFASEVPFFHHELFHIYHGQFLPEDKVMWIALWAEGLATYASEKLNPRATLTDLMLDFPVGMVKDINKSAAYHWNDLSSKLTSRKDDDYESYFLFSSKNKKITKRAGYYLGYLIAKEIGKTKSVVDLAKMDAKEILPMLEAEMAKMNGFGFHVEQDKDDPDSSDVYVDGTIDNKPYRFRLDTGAGRTSIKSDGFTSGFKVVGTKTGAGAFAKTTDDLIIVPQIQIGSLLQSQTTVVRTPKSASNRANLLGMDFLKAFPLHFLYDSRRVEVVDVTALATKVSLLDLFMGENNHPYVDLIWEGGIKAKGVWDTGAGMTLFDSAFMKKHPKLFTKVGTSIGTDSSGTSQETPVYQVTGFTLGGKRFPATKAVVIDLSVPNSTIKTPMDFILGYNVQKKANWIFDFPNKKWAISKMLE